MLNRMTDSLAFHGTALGLRAERQRLIASNIANADTPGYQAREMNFASALREASGQATPRGALSVTSTAHLAPTAGMRGEAGLLYATPSQTNLDSNTVDMDRERAAFADNSVKFEATLRFINSDVRSMLDAIRGQQ